MGEIVSLESRKPHQSGEALCTICQHKFVAVAPCGIFSFECPSCHSYRAHFVGFCGAQTGKSIFMCNYCDGQKFEIVYLEGCLCITCGFMHDWNSVLALKP